MIRHRCCRAPAVLAGSGGTPPVTSLNAATAPANGQGFNLGHAFANWNCVVSVTGAPASFSVQLQGSLDGQGWTNIGAAQTAAGSQTTLNVPWSWVRAVLGSLTGGTNPTVSATIAGY